MSANATTTRRLVLVAAGAFVFAFSMVPLYRVACEKVFGIKLADEATAPAGGPAAAGAAPLAGERSVTVHFDGTVNSKLKWQFAPLQLSLQVVPGREYEAQYVARNLSPLPLVGKAAYSLAPAQASAYFNKTECFCFTQQQLAAGEQRTMPVRFVVDPDLPADVHAVTLSYTFFLDEAATAQLQVPATASPATARSAP